MGIESKLRVTRNTILHLTVLISVLLQYFLITGKRHFIRHLIKMTFPFGAIPIPDTYFNFAMKFIFLLKKSNIYKTISYQFPEKPFQTGFSDD
jgi:hypothetical protein